MVPAADKRYEMCPPFINPQLAKAVANPLRARILVELNKRAMSPSQYANESGQPVPKISRKFRELEWPEAF